MTAAVPVSAADAIRAAGLRVTEPRRAVFTALAGHPHASAEDLHAHLPEVSLQSVYNALGDFATAGLVRRIEPAGHPMMFELRVADNHHHLVCTGCGAIEDVDCAVGHAPCLIPSETQGYRLATAEITYWGLCADCAQAADPA